MTLLFSSRSSYFITGFSFSIGAFSASSVVALLKDSSTAIFEYPWLINANLSALEV